jgi:heterodisulfide reductase subunit A
VDVKAVSEYIKSLSGVVISCEYKYMCSDPGQELIQKDIKEHSLNRIIVASCSPLLHEHTFRTAVEKGGLNPYYFQMVNIREDVSWVHTDMKAATEKAKDLSRAAVQRVFHHKSLETKHVKIHPDVLIVGGGIAGIHAALTLANAGKKVYLIERNPTIGGHMAMFDKTFPTLDCAACILTPKMSQVKNHPNIILWTYSEVAKVDGYVGNYKISIRRKPRYVNEELCVGCMDCIEKCVYKEGKTPDEFNVGLSKRKPIYIPFPQATPQIVSSLNRDDAKRHASKHAIEKLSTLSRKKKSKKLKSVPSFLRPDIKHLMQAEFPFTVTENIPTCIHRWKWNDLSMHPVLQVAN